MNFISIPNNSNDMYSQINSELGVEAFGKRERCAVCPTTADRRTDCLQEMQEAHLCLTCSPCL